MSNDINLRKAESGDTLYKLISDKLCAENGGNAVKLSASVWNQILDAVDEQQRETGDVYKGGSERKNWGKNYVIFVGQVVSLSKAVWNKIKELAGIKSEQQVETSKSVKKEQSDNAVPIEIDLASQDCEAKQVINPDGSKKYVVTRNGENVRYTSMDIEYDSEGKLIGYIEHFPEGDMAFDPKGRLLPNGIHAVQTFRNEEQQIEYRNALDNAKEILIKNVQLLGLSEEEVELINKIDIESIDFGAARFDSNSGLLLFNINDPNTPSKNDFVKVIIHELTHATKGNPERNTQSEERMCETRAIKSSLKLIQAGKLEPFMLPNGIGLPPINVTTLSTDEMIDNYVNRWLIGQEYDKRLPAS